MLVTDVQDELPGYIDCTLAAKTVSQTQHKPVGDESESTQSGHPRPTPPKPPTASLVWDEDLCDRVLQAQLRTVDFLAYDLSVRPCLFIIRNFRRGFLHVYIQQRAKWSTVSILFFILILTLVVPSAVAHTLVPYECFAYPVRMSEAEFTNSSEAFLYTADLITGKLVFERTDCEVFEYLLDWLMMLIPGGISLLLVVIAYFILERPGFHAVNTQIAYWILSWMPKIFMSGLGSSHDRHNSAWQLMKRAGLADAWSWVHDYFGSAEKARIVFLVGVVNTVGSAITGFCTALGNNFNNFEGEPGDLMQRATNVLLGTITGALVGLAIMRITFAVMNEVLSPSDFFIQIITAELKAHQPHHRGDDPDIINGAVESALHSIRTTSFEGFEDSSIQHVVMGIQDQGEDILRAVVSWIAKYASEVHTECGPCFDLFKCMGSFACTEHELAALSLLDKPAFLISLFDVSGEIMDHIRANIDCKVERAFRKQFPAMKDVYISYPNCKICKQNGNRIWEIQKVEFHVSDAVSGNFLRLGGYSLSDRELVSKRELTEVEPFESARQGEF